MARGELRVPLQPDRAGVVWDLLLYVPTVAFLVLWALKLWFAGGENQWMSYPLLFLGSFFFFAGAQRIARRLLLVGTAPVMLDINRERIKLRLKNGEAIALLRDVRFYPDMADKSFGISGIDGQGNRHQFVFHRGQLGEHWEAVKKALARYQA